MQFMLTLYACLYISMSALNFECTICVLLQCYRLLVVFSPLLQNYHLICDTHFNTIVIDKVN